MFPHLTGARSLLINQKKVLCYSSPLGRTQEQILIKICFCSALVFSNKSRSRCKQSQVEDIRPDYRSFFSILQPASYFYQIKMAERALKLILTNTLRILEKPWDFSSLDCISSLQHIRLYYYIFMHKKKMKHMRVFFFFKTVI